MFRLSNHNPRVGGSSPSSATKFQSFLLFSYSPLQITLCGEDSCQLMTFIHLEWHAVTGLWRTFALFDRIFTDAVLQLYECIKTPPWYPHFII